MSKYCNTKVLEKNWFHWLLSSSVADLEPYRESGLLWTKVIGSVNNNSKKPTLPDPRNSNRSHCIALATPVYFNSYDGNSQLSGTVFVSGKPTTIALSEIDVDLNLLSDSWLHKLDNPFVQRDEIIPSLKAKGYIRELPTRQTWHATLEDIDRMCKGIAKKFKQQSEEEELELSNDAILQITKKLATYKLVYTPGRAPVFNLLTTAIHRCMFSIMNRRKAQRNGLNKFVEDVTAGIVPKYR